MIYGHALVKAMDKTPLAEIKSPILLSLQQAMSCRRHGLQNEWDELLTSLPDIIASESDFSSEVVRVGRTQDVSLSQRNIIKSTLLKLQPWRKGPFEMFGIFIDSEWRSDLKWSRLEDKITPLHGRLVLDVGCGNGYYVYRMLGAGARFVLGIDPSLLVAAQFHGICKYTPNIPVSVLPLKLEDFPLEICRQRKVAFDTTFSMGVLYHRKNPEIHLQQLYQTLRPGGELVLETLVIKDGEGDVLKPATTYAKMRNVWNIPSLQILSSWLMNCGFVRIRNLDVSTTTSLEQRPTQWMIFESLDSFLNPEDSGLTIEGYPAPRRALVCAERPV